MRVIISGSVILQLTIIQSANTKVISSRYLADNTWSSWEQNYDTSLLTNSALLGPLASALGVPLIDGGRFRMSAVNNMLLLPEGIFLAGCNATDFSGGSLYFAIKNASSQFQVYRIDTGNKFAVNYNSGGTWVADTTTTDNKDTYVWALRLA